MKQKWLLYPMVVMGGLLIALLAMTPHANSSPMADVEAPNNTRGGTQVGGDLNSDTTWTVAGSPYLMTSNVTVKPNVTLTIEPGVLVQARGSNRVLRVEGHLEAAGAENNGITFTSEADTDGAD